jgi:hypothetical protein
MHSSVGTMRLSVNVKMWQSIASTVDRNRGEIDHTGALWSVSLTALASYCMLSSTGTRSALNGASALDRYRGAIDHTNRE